MTDAQADLLRLLEGKLLTVRPDLFDLHDWFASRAHPHDCDTAACALGWAVRVPEIVAAGLTAYGPTPVCRDRYGFEAAQEVFGLSYAEAMWLFEEDSYRPGAGPKDVAARIYRLRRERKVDTPVRKTAAPGVAGGA